MPDQEKPKPGGNLVVLSGVVARYPGSSAPALSGVDLSVRAGEFVSVLGPSGSGKTTLLRVIAGFERVESGEVSLGDRLVSSPTRHVDPDRRNVGLVFQDYALFPHLTVAENVAFGLDSAVRNGVDGVAEVLEMVGLDRLRGRYPHELSGGQQQRVALARSLAPDPIALLFDEPFSNLDRQLRASLRREVQAIVREHGTTAVLVTHDREEALGIADRVAVMLDGRIEQVDAPERVYLNPRSAEVARLVGPSDMLRGRVAGPYVDTEAGRFRYRSPNGPLGNGTFVEVVMRAHDLELGPWDGGANRRVVYREYQGEFTQYGVQLPTGRVVRVNRRSIAPLDVGVNVIITAPFDRPVLAYPEPPRA